MNTCVIRVDVTYLALPVSVSSFPGQRPLRTSTIGVRPFRSVLVERVLLPQTQLPSLNFERDEVLGRYGNLRLFLVRPVDKTIPWC